METETQSATEEAAPVRNMRQRTDHGSPSNTVVLGPRDSLVGNLKVDGEINVQGTAEGELHASGDINVEGGGTVKARIEARNVTVRGTVSGDVTAKNRLVLAGSGALMGNVKVGRLSIEDGATLNGNVTMGSGRNGHHEKPEDPKEG